MELYFMIYRMSFVIMRRFICMFVVLLRWTCRTNTEESYCLSSIVNNKSWHRTKNCIRCCTFIQIHLPSPYQCNTELHISPRWEISNIKSSAMYPFAVFNHELISMNKYISLRIIELSGILQIANTYRLARMQKRLCNWCGSIRVVSFAFWPTPFRWMKTQI